jgi:CheY-like chemotaxis protein
MAVVVVADDNVRVRQVIARTLERAGHTVFAEADGESAWERVRTGHPDLVILDGVMPGTDGFEICERIHSDSRTAHIPVILCSGWLPDDGQVRYAAATLPKPFMPGELMDRVAQVLAGT